MADRESSHPVLISGRAVIPIGIVATTVAAILGWVGVWAITRILDHGDRITAIEHSRYTAKDARTDRADLEARYLRRLDRLEELIERRTQRLEAIIERAHGITPITPAEPGR